MRRLFEITYICPMCGQKHVAEVYAESDAQNLDELHGAVRQGMRKPENSMPLLLARSRDIHQDWGDYEELATRLVNTIPRPEGKITKIELTADEEISCEGCGQKFKTLAELGFHEGRGGPPENGGHQWPVKKPLDAKLNQRS